MDRDTWALLDIHNFWLKATVTMSYIILCIMPFLWLFGIVPPLGKSYACSYCVIVFKLIETSMNKNLAENIKKLCRYRSLSHIILYIISHYDFHLTYLEALVLWVIEQLQVFCFGGSPTYSILRSFANIAASCTSYAVLFYYINVAYSRIPGKYFAHYRLPWIISQYVDYIFTQRIPYSTFTGSHSQASARMTFVMVFSTILGYLLSLDIINSSVRCLYQLLTKIRTRRLVMDSKFQHDNTYCEIHKIEARKRKDKQIKSSEPKKHMIPSNGYLSGIHYVKNYVTILLHLIFIFSSTVVVLFLPIKKDCSLTPALDKDSTTLTPSQHSMLRTEAETNVTRHENSHFTPGVVSI